jgi:hypothetical protein
MLTVTQKIDAFLDRMSRDTGIDRSNLIRMRLWEWMREEQDRALAERRLSEQVKPDAQKRHRA